MHITQWKKASWIVRYGQNTNGGVNAHEPPDSIATVEWNLLNLHIIGKPKVRAFDQGYCEGKQCHSSGDITQNAKKSGGEA